MIFSSLNIDLYSRVTGIVDAFTAPRYVSLILGFHGNCVFMKKPTNKYELRPNP